MHATQKSQPQFVSPLQKLNVQLHERLARRRAPEESGALRRFGGLRFEVDTERGRRFIRGQRRDRFGTLQVIALGRPASMGFGRLVHTRLITAVRV